MKRKGKGRVLREGRKSGGENEQQGKSCLSWLSCVTVLVRRLDHFLDFCLGVPMSQRPQDNAELFTGDLPVLVLVEHLEDLLQVCNNEVWTVKTVSSKTNETV